MRSLAVLPFVNTSGETEADYLSDGITESIINSLSQLPKLRVVPRSTVFAYKGVAVNPRSVGLALNVDSLVTGRVMQQGSLLNIQAELVDVATETQVWGDQYRHPVSELISLQEQIAWQISEALRIRLSAPAEEALPQARDRQRRRLPGVSPRAARVEQVARRGVPKRDRALRGGHQHRSEVRAAHTRGSRKHTAPWATTASFRPTWP